MITIAWQVASPDEVLCIAILRWLKTVSSTYICIGRYNHFLSLDAKIMVSKNCPIIGEDAGTIFVTQYVTIATV